MRNNNNLIITADDFGLCESVNDAIIDSYKCNNITNTSILANMPNLQKNSELIHKSQISYGLHFSINRGTPFNKNSTLCDSSGNFFSRNMLFKRIFLGKINPTDVLNEFEHQLKLCEEVGLNITHFDSDNHTHFHPFIFFSILKTVIKKQMSFRSLNPLFFNFSKKKRLMRQIFFKSINVIFKMIIKKKLYANEFFCSPYDFENSFKLNESSYLNVLKNLKTSNSIELMVHPYYDSMELRKYYPNKESVNFLNNCFTEANILTSKNNIFSKYDIELNNFNYLRLEFLKSL